MLHATTPKDLTTALVKMGLKATEKTAQVGLCGVHGLFWPFCKRSSEAKSPKIPIFRLNFKMPKQWERQLVTRLNVCLGSSYKTILDLFYAKELTRKIE